MALFDEPTCYKEKPTAYFPIVMSSDIPDRRWRLRVQQRPVVRITRSGVTPTLQEIVDVLGATTAPIWLVNLIQVLVEVAQVEEESDGSGHPPKPAGG